MPYSAKRKRSDSKCIEIVAKKLKVLKEKLKQQERRSRSRSRCRRRSRRIIESSTSSSSRHSTLSPENHHGGTNIGTHDDDIAPATQSKSSAVNSEPQKSVINQLLAEGPTSAVLDGCHTVVQDLITDVEEGLDCSILEILGDDPSVTVEYGKEVHKEISNRLEHIAVKGLTKEARKELCEKYLVPSNCSRTGAPKLNTEVKAALNDIFIKRDKAIEARQKQLASAIACIAQLASDQIATKTTNQESLKKIMDCGRLLCNIQYAESVTRRNFASYSVKKDIKEHLLTTQIDTLLFGVNLPEALRSAKAVNKSATDLKDVKQTPYKSRPNTTTQKTQPPKNLNWKSPASARRQAGPSRSRQPAPQHSQHNQPGNSSKQSSYQQKWTRRR